MNILVIGELINFKEFGAKFGDSHAYTWQENPRDVEIFFAKSDVVFDFTLIDAPKRLNAYIESESKVFVNTTNVNLKQLLNKVDSKIGCAIFGFCGMPTLFNRPHLEISLHKKDDATLLKQLCKNLHTDFMIVDDRTGMVTPRVICMIINEAYFAIEEGVASREDIDSAMKFGTNYPFGPFEWAKKIGLSRVCQLLNELYRETNDDRYKTCALLKTEAL